MVDWAERIRMAVAGSGRELWALASEAGIHYSNLRRFMAGGCGLSLASAQRLCGIIGLDLMPSGNGPVVPLVRDTSSLVRDTTKPVRTDSPRPVTTFSLPGISRDLAAEREERLAKQMKR